MTVPDVSVALKCFVAEACCDKVLAQLEGYISGQRAIAVSELHFDLAW
jgi:hypothetical protein